MDITSNVHQNSRSQDVHRLDTTAVIHVAKEMTTEYLLGNTLSLGS